MAPKPTAVSRTTESGRSARVDRAGDDARAAGDVDRAAADADPAASNVASDATRTEPRDARAVAPIGSVLLVALAVLLAAGVGAATLGGPGLPSPAPTASLSLSADGDALTVRHLAGDPLDADELRLEVAVDGEPLAHQPPVPFFSATGFRAGPTGAFNVAGDTTLSPGESATFRVASTNDPVPASGDRVAVTVYSDGSRVARLTARVQ